MNFSELQILLEKQNTEVIENQKESLVGRKALAERTKGMLRQAHTSVVYSPVHVQR